jgi:outer membrane protein insertion porin family
MQVRGGYATGGLLSGFDAGRSLALPLSERFLMGGSGSVRGFGEGAIQTVEGDASGGDVFVQANTELRYSLVPSLGVEGAAFFDAGELARDAGALSAGELRTSAGLGLRWVIANMIPVAIDYGTNMNRRIGEPFGRVHLNVGYTF